MKHLFFAAVLTAGYLAGVGAASAQLQQGLLGLPEIPAPPPPVLQSPSLPAPAMQSPSPGVLAPPALNTFSDRTTQCLQAGDSFGLTGSDLGTFSTQCATETGN
jgi:hypothetical protein